MDHAQDTVELYAFALMLHLTIPQRSIVAANWHRAAAQM
jgi:hypothetical protein